jgi:hypothetical protein
VRCGRYGRHSKHGRRRRHSKCGRRERDGRCNKLDWTGSKAGSMGTEGCGSSSEGRNDSMRGSGISCTSGTGTGSESMAAAISAIGMSMLGGW